ARGRPGTGRRGHPAADALAPRSGAERQALAEGSREAGVADLGLRLLDRVLDPPERGTTRIEVDQHVGRTWIAVARLADGAGVEQPARRSEIDLGAGRSVPAGKLAPFGLHGERNVAVADEHDRGGR